MNGEVSNSWVFGLIRRESRPLSWPVRAPESYEFGAERLSVCLTYVAQPRLMHRG